MTNIKYRIKKIISEKLDIKIDNILDHTHFLEDLNADSLDKIELIMALEDEFNLEITDEESEKINTVKDAINYIQKNVHDKK